MGIRSRRLAGPLLGALVMLIVISTAAAGGARSSSIRPCARASSSTLVETEKVRIFALPPESLQFSGKHHAAIAGRPVFACLKAADRALLLNAPVEGHAFWTGVDDDPIAVKGPLVAYAFSQYYTDFHKTWIRVRNLNTGAIGRSCPIGGAIAPSSLPHVTDIVLSSNGEVGWNAEGEGPDLSEHPVPGCNPSV